jgi:hypothetical protein
VLINSDKEVQPMTVQCCVCKKVRDDQVWKLEDRIHRADVSHTYCPVCLKASVAAMAVERHRADLVQPLGA